MLLLFSSLLFPFCFLVSVRKFVLFCFVVFATLVDGMGGVMNEGGLEGLKM